MEARASLVRTPRRRDGGRTTGREGWDERARTLAGKTRGVGDDGDDGRTRWTCAIEASDANGTGEEFVEAGWDDVDGARMDVGIGRRGTGTGGWDVVAI